jgi:Helix-turn-helix of DDE superfamily endonuclease/DDE superfamily endonuclease
MLTYAKLKRNRRKFLALTGLTPKEFQLLLPAFQRVYARRFPSDQTLRGTARQRKRGGGRKGSLDSPEQKLLLALVYFKAYPLQELLGEVFDLSQSRANRWVHQLLPVLQPALKDLGVRPERNPRQFARHERQTGEPLDLIIDGTERRRQRPKNPEKQALHYSGRKKMHSDKNVVIANRKTKRIGYLSQTYAGKTQDKKIADRERITYPRAARLHKDTAFQGYEPRVRKTYQPKKATQGRTNARRKAAQSSCRASSGPG